AHVVVSVDQAGGAGVGGHLAVAGAPEDAPADLVAAFLGLDPAVDEHGAVPLGDGGGYEVVEAAVAPVGQRRRRFGHLGSPLWFLRRHGAWAFDLSMILFKG